MNRSEEFLVYFLKLVFLCCSEQAAQVSADGQILYVKWGGGGEMLRFF